MRLHNGALLTVLLGVATDNYGSCFTLRSLPPSLHGRNSIVEMVDSYLDNLVKPSSDTMRGPEPGYVYKKRPGAEVVGSNGSYLDALKANSNGASPSNGAYGGYLDNLAGADTGSHGASMGNYLGDLTGPSSASGAAKPAVAPETMGSYMDEVSSESKTVVAAASGGNYLDNLSKQPASFEKPKGGYMYRAKTAPSGSARSGYLDNLGGGASSQSPASYSPPPPVQPAPPAQEAAAGYTPPPPPPPASEPVARSPPSSGSSAPAVTTSRGYLDVISGPSGAAPKRPGGYMYKPSRDAGSAGKRGPSAYLDNVSSSATAPPQKAQESAPPPPPPPVVEAQAPPVQSAPAATGSSSAPVTSGSYLDAMSGASSLPKPAVKSGGYMYRPANTGTKKPAPGGYLDSISGSGTEAVAAAVSSPPPPPAASSGPPPAQQASAPEATQAAAAAASKGDYLSALGGATNAPAKKGGYMYSPKISREKKGQSGYLDSMGGGTEKSSYSYSSSPPQQQQQQKQQVAKPAASSGPAGASGVANPYENVGANPVTQSTPETASTPPQRSAASVPDSRPADTFDWEQSGAVEATETDEVAFKPLVQWSTSEWMLTVLFFMLFVEVILFGQNHPNFSLSGFSNLASNSTSTIW